jgi:hypothetical protein
MGTDRDFRKLSRLAQRLKFFSKKALIGVKSANDRLPELEKQHQIDCFPPK